MPSYVIGPRTMRETVFSQCKKSPKENSTVEINHFEGSGPEWLVPKKILLLLVKSRTFRGREGIDLLVHACHSISPFSFLISNFSFLFLFLFSSQYLFPCCDFLLEVTITFPPCYAQQGFFI